MAKPTPDQLHDKKVEFILASIGKFEASVIKAQDKLLDLVLSEYLPLFDVKDGMVANSTANDALISKVDNLFDRLAKSMQRDVLGGFVSNLLTSATMSADYYVGMGFGKKVVSKLLRDKVRLEGRLGITATGRLKKSGYLYRLGQTHEVRTELQEYVIRNLTGDVAYTDFQLGFRNLVVGNKRVKGLPTNGALQKHFQQYAYDSFNQLDAVTNKTLAAELGLKHFVYQGSTINTSRKFCIKRAGKAFKVSETAKWKNDPTLPGQSSLAAYRPLIDRGRWNCRHFIKYITAELYTALTGKNA